MKYKTKYFPFSPGIPWKTRGRYIVPEINADTWEELLKDREPVVLCHGGLLESYYSLYLVAALNKLDKQVYWAGDKKFNTLISANGIAKYKDTPDMSNKYPVPLFMGKDNYIYFNCLNNYLIMRNYYLRADYERYECVIQQIFENLMMPVEKPKLNYFDFTEYKKWATNNKFYDNKRYIFIVLEHTKYSNHYLNCLGWNWNDVLNFAAIIRRFDISIVVCSDNKVVLPYNSNIFMAPVELSVIYPLIEKSWMILSQDIDCLLISLSVSKANIMFNNTRELKKSAFRINKNAEKLESDNLICGYKELNPMEVYSKIEDLI